MKKIFILLVIILAIFLLAIFNCQQAGSSGGGGGSGGSSNSKSSSLKAIQIAAGDYYTVVIFEDGTVKCWGDNNYGQLGYGDITQRGDGPGEMGDNLPTVDLGTGKIAVQITAGYAHVAVLFDDNRVKCWGHNTYGKLGYGDQENRGDEINEMGDFLFPVNLGLGRTVKQIIVAGFHTIALLDNDTVKCWGNNTLGQLGYEDTNNRGDNDHEMGDNLFPVNLGTGRIAVQIAAGDYHTIALLDNGTVKCWGYNEYGQLGYGNTNNIGDNIGEMGDALSTVNLGTGQVAMKVAAGNYHTIVILENGSVKCWGQNTFGQLGYGDTNNRGDDPGEMGDSLPIVDLGTGRTAVQVAAGIFHTAVLLDNGTVKCWGYNNEGQLGYGDHIARGDNPDEMGDNLLTVNLGTGRTAVQIAAGVKHTVVLLDDGTVKCWGDNSHGQLGYGDIDNRGDNINEMGDNLLPVDL